MFFQIGKLFVSWKALEWKTVPTNEILDIAQIIVEGEEEIINVPFAVIENVTIYLGCIDEPNTDQKKKCMSTKVKQFVQANFNTELAANLGL
ncbi:MAG: protein TonB [Ulvibacter sp.]